MCGCWIEVALVTRYGLLWLLSGVEAGGGWGCWGCSCCCCGGGGCVDPAAPGGWAPVTACGVLTMAGVITGWNVDRLTTGAPPPPGDAIGADWR